MAVTQTKNGIDHGYAWVVMLANFGAFFVCSGALYTSGVVFTTLQERFGENVAKTALAGSIFTCMNSLAAPIGAIITDKFSCRTSVMVGGALMALGYLITGFSTHLETCILSFGLCTGIGAGIAFSALFIVNGFHFRDKLNFSMGVSSAGGGCGLFAMAPIFEFSKELYGYNGLFLSASAFCLQLLVFGLLMRVSVLEKHSKHIRKLKASANIMKDSNILKRNLLLYLPLLRDKATISLTLTQLFICSGIYTTFMFWPSLCIENGFTSMQASFFLSVSGIAAILGRLSSGVIASYVDDFVILGTSLIMFGIPCVTSKFYASSFIGQIINGVILGAMNGVPVVIITRVTIKCVGVNNLSAAMGLQLFLGGIGGILVPVICGCMVNSGLTYGDVFILCGACVLTAACLALITKYLEKNLAQESNKELDAITIDTEKQQLDQT